MSFNVSYIFQAIDNYTGVAQKIAASTRQVNEAMNQTISRTALMQERMQELHQTTGKLFTELLAAGGTLFTLALPIHKAIQFEEAMANVRKVVDFDTPAQFKQMGIDIQNLSKSIPMSQQNLAAIVAAAGQFGIKRKDLMEFTETAAKMGVAFDISADEAGRSMAVMSNIFGLTIPQVGELGDAINYLSNSVAATAPGMIQVILRVGNIAKGFGLAKEQTAALSAAILQLGVEPERASTALIGMLNTLQLIGVGSKEQQAAFQALGLDARTFGAMIKQDAVGALMAVSKAYSTMDPNKIAIINKALFGEGLEASNIRSLLSSGDKMKEVFAMVADKSKLAGSMQKEFAVRSQTTSNQLALLSNRVNNISINLGSALLPALNNVVSGVGFLADIIADISAKFPLLTQIIYGAVFAIVLFRVVSLSAALIMAQVKAAVIAFQLAMSALPVVMGVARMAMLALNAAFLANPIGVIIGGIALLSAALYPLLKQFGGLDNMLSWIKEKVVSLINAIRELFSFNFDSITSKIGGFLGFGTPNAAMEVNSNVATNSMSVQSNSSIDINLKGNTDVVESVKSKTDGKANLSVGQNMMNGAY